MLRRRALYEGGFGEIELHGDRLHSGGVDRRVEHQDRRGIARVRLGREDLDDAEGPPCARSAMIASADERGT